MRVVVVGSGVVGVASAWFLAQHGCEVTVLERGDAVACGTSHANAGMLTPSMADPWNAPGILWHVLGWLGQEDAPFLLRLRAIPSVSLWGLSFLANSRPARFRINMEKNLRLARYSLQVLRELRDSLGLHYDERANGTIKVFRTQKAFDHGVARNELLKDLGLDVRALDPQQVVEVEPSLAPVRDKLAGGIYCPSDESGDACAFAGALADKAKAAGVTFRLGTAVAGFEGDGNRITAARTTQGRQAADAFVVAAGCWSPQLLRPLGIALPVRPVKGYSITVPVGKWNAPPRMPVIDDALHTAVTPLGDRLRVAGTAEIAGFNRELTPERVENLFALLLALYPSYAPHLDRAHASPWAGLRPVSADGVPRIGRLKFDNLFVNSGHGHLGWTLSAGSARLLADLVCGHRPAIDPAPYDAQRRT
jgi:D-amino-acid dehydrogenase